MAVAQDGDDVGRGGAPLRQQHEGMVGEVGGLAGEQTARLGAIGAGAARAASSFFAASSTSVASSATLRPARSTPPSRSRVV